MTDPIPYTHWAFFDDEDSAKACAQEFESRYGCVTVVDPPDVDCESWLLRASRSVVDTVQGHAQAQEVVERHGGGYDGGEPGQFV